MDKPINIPIKTTADTRGIKEATKDLQANGEAAKKAADNMKILTEGVKKFDAAQAAKVAAANPSPKPSPAKKSTSKSRSSSKSKSKKTPATKPKPKATPAPPPKSAPRQAPVPVPAPKPAPVPVAKPKAVLVPRQAPVSASAPPPAATPAPAVSPKADLQPRASDVAQPKIPGKMVSERLGKGAALAAAGLKHLGTVAGKFLPAPMEVLLKLTEHLSAGFMRWYENNQRLKGSVESFTETLEKAVSGGIDRFMDGMGDMLGEGDLVAELLDDITVALGGETAAMKELNKPLSMYADAMEEARTEQEKFNDALEKERDLLDDVKSALEDQLALHEAKIDTAEVEAELEADKARKAVEASSDDEATKRSKLRDIETDLELKKYDLRKQKRGAELEAQQLELTEREETLKKADGAMPGQKDRVKRANDLTLAKNLVEALRIKNNGKMADPTAKKEWESALALRNDAEKNAKGLGTEEAEREKLQQMEKNAELQKEKIDELQKDMKRKSGRLAEEQKQDDMTTERKLEDISGEHGQKHQAGLLAAKREPLVAPMEPVKLSSPPPPPVTEIPKEKLTPENEATNAGRMALRDALNDGKGNTGAEMAVISQIDQTVREGKASRDAALLQALHAMRELQQGGSQMEMQLTSVLSTYGSKLSQMASTMNELENRTRNIELNSRR